MAKKILISGALANTYGQVKTQALVDFLAGKVDDFDIYIRRLRPGYIRAAAFDWQGILGTTASIIDIGDLLWRAYEKFIKPIREKEKDSRSFLYISLKRPDGGSIQFSLGTDILNREDFLKFFSEAIKELRGVSDSEMGEDPAIKDVENSDLWEKINKEKPINRGRVKIDE